MIHAPAGTPCRCGIDGWLPGVSHVPSPAHSYTTLLPGKMQPIAMVVHTVEGWQHVMMRPDYKSNSYHFTFRLDGRIVQHVPIDTAAWHAGRVRSPTWRLYRGGNPNHYTVGISAEGAARADMNPNGLPLAWTEPQVDAAIEVIRWVAAEAGIALNADTLTEHSQIDTVSRFDPGPRWPKTHVIAAASKEDRVSNAYIVQPGDTLWAISRKPGFPTPQQLVDWNGIKDPALIRKGQVLRLDPNVIPPAAATGEDLRDLQEIETLAKRVRERLEAD